MNGIRLGQTVMLSGCYQCNAKLKVRGQFLHCVDQRFSTPVLAPPRSAHFACLCCLNTPDSDHQLIRRKFHEWTVFRLTCSLHSVHCSLLPKHEKSVDVYFTSELIYSLIYSRICATQCTQCIYTSVNKSNLNSCLAHFNALWMEHIRSLRTGMMVEYPVKSTSQGTYGRIEQRSEVKRETYKMCRAGGREDWSWKPLV